MDDLHKSFDWLAFFGRVFASVVFATLWLADSLHRHTHTGAIAAVSIGYLILPVLAYLYTRYYNLKLIAGIVEAVRRKTGGRTRTDAQDNKS
jgi:hypothetical protein